MSIYDIHTHCLPQDPGTAIVQLTPDHFYCVPEQYYSVGIHPWEITPNWQTQLGQMAIMGLCPQVLMIGEAGLDKTKAAVPIEEQTIIFREQVKLSEILHKPLIVHCVKAMDELLHIHKRSKATQPWIYHGFRGGKEQARQLRNAGIYISLGKYYNTDLLQSLPLENLLLETDDTSDIDAIYHSVSEKLHIGKDELAQLVSSNIQRLLDSPF